MLFGLFLALIFCNNDPQPDTGWARPDSGWWWDTGGNDCSPWVILQDSSNVSMKSLTMEPGDRVTVTVKNGGNCDAAISRVYIGGDAEFSASEPAESVVSPGSATTLELAFDATAPGTYAADLVVESNDPFSPTTVELTAVVVADLTVDPEKVDLGAQELGCSTPFQLQLTSNAGATLSEIQGLGGEWSSTTSLPLSLAAGVPSSLSFAYTPVDEGGDSTTLTVVTETGTADIALSASAAAAEKVDDTATGDGSTLSFPLSKTPVQSTISVSVDGAVVPHTFAEGAVTLESAPAEGAAVSISYVVQPICE